MFGVEPKSRTEFDSGAVFNSGAAFNSETAFNSGTVSDSGTESNPGEPEAQTLAPSLLIQQAGRISPLHLHGL